MAWFFKLKGLLKGLLKGSSEIKDEVHSRLCAEAFVGGRTQFMFGVTFVVQIWI